jgi:hypothetical protein
MFTTVFGRMHIRQLLGCGGVRHGDPIASAASNSEQAAWTKNPRWDGLTESLNSLGSLIEQLPEDQIRTELEQRHSACAAAVRTASAERKALATNQGLATREARLAPAASDYLKAAQGFQKAIHSLDALTSLVQANADKLKPHWSKIFFKAATVALLTIVAVGIGVLAAPLVSSVVAGIVAAGMAYAIGAGIAAGLAGGSYLAGMIAAIHDLADSANPAKPGGTKELKELNDLKNILGDMKKRALEAMDRDPDGALEGIESLTDSSIEDWVASLALASELPPPAAKGVLLSVAQSPLLSGRPDLAQAFRTVIDNIPLDTEARNDLRAVVDSRMANGDPVDPGVRHGAVREEEQPASLHYPGEDVLPFGLDAMDRDDEQQPALSPVAKNNAASPIPFAELRAQKAERPANPYRDRGDAKALAAPIVVRVWPEKLTRLATGHAAMTVNSRSGLEPLYISWWPTSKVSPHEKRGYRDDKRSELLAHTKNRLEELEFTPRPGQKRYIVDSKVTPGEKVADWGVSASKVYLPQYGDNRLAANGEDCPRLFGLDAAGIHALAATKSPKNFTVISPKENCAGMVLQMLRAGGAGQFGTTPSLKLVARPSQALKYAGKIVERIDALNKRADALIERHVKLGGARDISLEAAWDAYEKAGGKSLQAVFSAEDINTADAFLLMRKAKAVMNMEMIADRPNALAVLCGLRNKVCELSGKQGQPSPAKAPAADGNFGEGTSRQPSTAVQSDSASLSGMFESMYVDLNPDVKWGDVAHAVESETSLAPREGFDPAEEYKILIEAIVQRHREISDKLSTVSGQQFSHEDGRETRKELNELEADLLAFTIGLRNAPTHFMALNGVRKVALTLKSDSPADNNGIRIRQNAEDPASFIPVSSLSSEQERPGETLQALFDACEDLAIKLDVHKQQVYTRSTREMLV